MDRIHLLMPMGGGGTRFGNKGFNVPKPLIMLQGRPFLYWATTSVTRYIDVCDITFIVLKEHVEKFSIDKVIREYFPDAKIHVIPEILNGAVLTCEAGLSEINDSLPVLFNDCDHAFLSPSFNEFARKADFSSPDAGLLTFTSDSPAFSYVQFDENKKVTGTIEKVVVSDEAICGAYYFKNRDTFLTGMKTYLERCAYKEYFVSGIYNELIKAGKTVETFKLSDHISFGTPDEYDQAVNDRRLRDLF